MSAALKKMAAVGLLAVVGLSPFALGSVHPVSYTAMQAAAFALLVLAVVGSALGSERCAPREFRPVFLLAACFGGLIAFQLLRLPSELLRVISPNTVSAVRSALPWKTNVPGVTISLYHLGTQRAAFQYMACFALLILVTHLFASRRGRLVLAWALTAIGTALALAGLYLHWRSEGRIYGIWPTVAGGGSFGPFVNRNHFAGYIEMVLPISAVLIFVKGLRERRSGSSVGMAAPEWPQIVSLCCFVLMFVSLVSSLSRGGMISAAAGGCVISAIAWRKAETRRAALTFAAVFVAGFLVGAFYAGPELVERISELYRDVTDPLATPRAQATRRTLDLVSLYPLFGAGLGSFCKVFTAEGEEVKGYNLTEEIEARVKE